MPVYSWKGIDSQGRVHSGMLNARSSAHLEQALLKKEIGLLHARSPLFGSRIASRVKQELFVHLASLLQAHFPVHDALLMIVPTIKQPVLRVAVEDIAIGIAEGMPLSEALELYDLSDELTRAVILVGEKTGHMGLALHSLVDHQASMYVFKARLKSALMGPLITLLFFMFIMLGIFIGVIPHFERYFASYNAPLPFITRLMVSLSQFMRSFHVVWLVLVVVSTSFALSRFLRIPTRRERAQRLVLRLPLIGPFLISVHQTYLLHAFGMLLKSGVPVSEALHVCSKVTGNGYIKKQVAELTAVVEAGGSLSSGWSRTILASAEIEAFLALGESSGELGRLIEHAAGILRQRVYGKIGSFVTLIHPFLILFLGTCIAFLIFAVYMPIITLSSLII